MTSLLFGNSYVMARSFLLSGWRRFKPYFALSKKSCTASNENSIFPSSFLRSLPEKASSARRVTVSRFARERVNVFISRLSRRRAGLDGPAFRQGCASLPGHARSPRAKAAPSGAAARARRLPRWSGSSRSLHRHFEASASFRKYSMSILSCGRPAISFIWMSDGIETKRTATDPSNFTRARPYHALIPDPRSALRHIGKVRRGYANKRPIADPLERAERRHDVLRSKLQ